MLIDCAKLVKEIDHNTTQTVQELTDNGMRPSVVELLATDNSAARSYAKTKEKKAASLGIGYRVKRISSTESEIDVLKMVADLNSDPSVHGIMLAMPTYKHLNADHIAGQIHPAKDVDGLGGPNTFFLATNQEYLGIQPATAIAAIHILESVTTITAKKILVLGRGRTVGRPLSAMLTNRNATVTVAHSVSIAVDQLVRTSDIVISAIGRPRFVEPEWLVKGQIVIDCGISFVDGRTVGDVDTAAASARGAFISPVPGGVGTVTNSAIFLNLLKAIQLQQREQTYGT